MSKGHEPKRALNPKSRAVHDARRPMRRSKGLAGGFSMYLRLWLYADLRCPVCGARGHWIDLPGVPRNFIRPKEADEVRMSSYTGEPLRKGETDEIWRCGNSECGRQTYCPEARAWTQGGGPYNVRPKETRVFAGNVSQGFAWEHDEDDEAPTGIDAVVNPWDEADDALDGSQVVARTAELAKRGLSDGAIAKDLRVRFGNEDTKEDEVAKLIVNVREVIR